MNRPDRTLRRALLPLCGFLMVFALHVLWHAFFSDGGRLQNQWGSIPGVSNSGLQQYLKNGDYYLGVSYASAIAFALAAFRRYRERQCCHARNLALGGLTLSGVLGAGACFLAGCCGSPMLIVYLNLFGASFLPFAKPLVAVLTLLSLSLGWWWLRRRENRSELLNLSQGPCSCQDEEEQQEISTKQ